MLDSTRPADLVGDIQKMRQRIETLEMSSRNVRQRAFINTYLAPAAQAQDTSFGVQGVHAGWTDATSFTTVLAGDCQNQGQKLYGALYFWLPTSHSLEWEVYFREYGASAVLVESGSESGATTVERTLFGVDLPDSCFTGTDRRNRFCRLDVNIRRTSGTGRVGVGFSQVPYTYPF